MVDARVLLIAIALRSTAGEMRSTLGWGQPPRWRSQSRLQFCRPKTAYVATLTVEPDDYVLFGIVDRLEGIELLWRRVAQPRTVTMA